MQQESIKSGFLKVPPSWLQHLLNKPWVKKQCVLYSASRQGVKRLEVFDLAPSLLRKEPAALIIPLTDCVKIAEDRYKGKDFAFSVVTREGSHMFAAVSIQELREWVDALQRIAFGQADCSRMLAASRSLTQEHYDDNALYGSALENQSVFRVTVDENEMTSRLQLAGPHLVQVTVTSVQLRSVSDRRLRASWLFSHIRRYGQARDSFVMEVGRSSETGPGSLVFRTRAAGELQTELHRVMAEYEVNRHSAAPDLPTSPPPPQPPPPPPPAPLETQTLGRPASVRKAKKTAIAKPPRKTKAGAAAGPAATAEDLPNVVPLVEKQWLLTQSLKTPSEHEPRYMNEATFGGLSAPFVNEPDELMYAEPEERTSAWRELGRSVEHVENMDSSSMLDTWDRGTAAALVKPLRPTVNAAGGRASMSYACLQHMPCSTAPSGAQYARLGATFGAESMEERTAAWAADQSQRQEAAAAVTEAAVAGTGEEVAADDQPVYENLPATSAGTQSGQRSEVSSTSKQGATVSHLVVNDATYTLLDKPMRGGSS